MVNAAAMSAIREHIVASRQHKQDKDVKQKTDKNNHMNEIKGVDETFPISDNEGK